MSFGFIALVGLFSLALPSFVISSGEPAGPLPCPIQGSTVVTIGKIDAILDVSGSGGGLSPSVGNGFVSSDTLPSSYSNSGFWSLTSVWIVGAILSTTEACSACEALPPSFKWTVEPIILFLPPACWFIVPPLLTCMSAFVDIKISACESMCIWDSEKFLICPLDACSIAEPGSFVKTLYLLMV